MTVWFATGVELLLCTVAVTLVPVVLGVSDAGEKVGQVTPVGSGAAQLSVTMPGEVVVVAFTFKVNVVDAPRFTALVGVLVVRLNEGVVLETESVTLVAVRVCPSAVPVTLMFLLPAVTEELVNTVSVEVLPGVTAAGLNEHVTLA